MLGCKSCAVEINYSYGFVFNFIEIFEVLLLLFDVTHCWTFLSHISDPSPGVAHLIDNPQLKTVLNSFAPENEMSNVSEF